MTKTATLLFQTFKFRVFLDNQTKKSGLEVESFQSQDVIADDYCRACCRSNAFNFHNTFTVHKRFFVPFLLVFLIHNWVEIKFDKQINLFTQGVSILCCLPNSCSIWLFFPDNLSLYQGKINHMILFSRTVCQHIRRTCSWWELFLGKAVSYF